MSFLHPARVARMTEHMVLSTLKKILGILLIVYGLVALVTPLTPASAIALFVGLELVGLSFLMPQRIRDGAHRVKHRLFHGRKSGINATDEQPRT